MIGFIGLGIMGRPMAKNLLKGGVDLMVNDLNEKAVAELVELGAKSGSYADLAANCERIILIVPNGAISKSIIFGENGLAKGLKAGQLVCDMSSVTPAESKECAEGLAKIGVGFLDAPVSGGEPGAIAGSLAIMVGGEEKDFDAMQDIFGIVGNSSILIGPAGSGSVAKLANQMIVNNTIAVVSEAYVLATKAGADPEKVYKAIHGGLAGSAVMDQKINKILDRDFKPGGSLVINHKDIKNCVAAAHALDVPIPYTAQLYEILQSLKVHGHIGDDHAGIIQYFEQLADVTVKRVQ